VPPESLAAAITHAGNAVDLLRNSATRAHTFPIAPEFTNWRSEQRAWATTCALLDQSHHMTDLFVEGPGVASVPYVRFARDEYPEK
jgi:vanillate/3-O-methylgallate O-demethylase